MRTRKFKTYHVKHLLTACVSICVFAHSLHARHKEDRVLIILDGSALMSAAWNDSMDRYRGAALFISELAARMQEYNHGVAIGLRLYGQLYDSSLHRCEDSRMEVRFSKDNAGQIYLRLQDIAPKGWGSVQHALQQAFQYDLKDTASCRYSIIWVTGGQDKQNSCTSEPCEEISRLESQTPLYKTYAVILQATGIKPVAPCFGKLFSVEKAGQIPDVILNILHDFPGLVQQNKTSRAINNPMTEQEHSSLAGRIETEQPHSLTTPEASSTGQATTLRHTVAIQNSGIQSDTLQTGYLNPMFTTATCNMLIIGLDEKTSMYITVNRQRDNSKKSIRLPEGNYKLISYLNSQPDTVSVRIKARMITDVRLR